MLLQSRYRRGRSFSEINSGLQRTYIPLYERAFVSLQRKLGSVPTYRPESVTNEEHAITDLEAFINLLKCALGTGCLAMPCAFYEAGWLLGLIGTLVLGSFVVYAMHVLINDINVLCKRYRLSVLSYSEAMELAFQTGPESLQPLGKPLAYLVDLLLGVYHFGVDCVYVVFIAKSIKLLADMYIEPLDIRIYMGLLTVPLLASFAIRELKYLVPFAVISNLLLILSVVIICSYLFGDLPSLSERQAVQPLQGYAFFFGTVLFSIESVGVILALQLKMLNPQNYLGTFGVLNRAMFIVIAFYALFGFFGYWRYGDLTASSVLNNLPKTEILPQCVLAMFALGIFFSYALQGYITVEIIWRRYIAPRVEDSIALEYLIRMALVLASVLVAIAYPNFGVLLSFVGSFCLAQLGLIYPGIINLCVCYREGYGLGKHLLWRALSFIVVGLVGCITGTLASLQAVKDQYNKLS
ncbi:proton-coupled amino acid transporter-like protein CG1139 isoform X1 [Drosophila busckii]|uniref:proton-coupled amino acid transporter-like protein CG1139 isoform X1 n=1 Tax=Drosophila busckii TaxID=30019 RepID=UPI00083EAEA6|nr:proton-coupled amino acid transporter-like protein CG1139 isoform X1 [Drosophila busckii]XP_017840835.2 proton-coupled amino acid transporter-like protein CG1139 isoform X1 [Drosophila busckii]